MGERDGRGFATSTHTVNDSGRFEVGRCDGSVRCAFSQLASVSCNSAELTHTLRRNLGGMMYARAQANTAPWHIQRAWRSCSRKTLRSRPSCDFTLRLAWPRGLAAVEGCV
jgi:hypothetical protein